MRKGMGRRAQAQRGSIVLPAVAALVVCLILLGAANLGYLFYVKRELQNGADLAALSAVQYVRDDSSCTQARAQALDALTRWTSEQAIIGLTPAQIEVQCGTWDPHDPRFPAPTHFLPEAARIGQAEPPQYAFNAVQVRIRRPGVAPVLPFAHEAGLDVMAVAQSGTPVAAFQVGTQLLRFNPNAALGSVLGLVGLSVDNLTLLDSAGLANAAITPAGLLNLLGVDLGVGGLGVLTPNGLAALQKVELLQLLDVSLSVIEDNALVAQVKALRQQLLGLGLGQVRIPLTGQPTAGGQTAGLFAFLGLGRDTPLGSAMDVQLGLGDLLKTAIAIGAAETGRALSVPELNALGLVSAKLGIVEPPTIAIGPVGTMGYSAQLRLLLNVDTDKLLGGLLKPLLSDVLGIRVKLPVAVDVVSAKGTLDALQCDAAPRSADIFVESRLLNLCVGAMDEASLMSSSRVCESMLAEDQLITLLHAPVLSGKLHVPALSQDELLPGVIAGETRSTATNRLDLGHTTDSLVTGLLNLLGGLFRSPTPGFSPDWRWDGDYSGPSGAELRARLVKSYLDLSRGSNGFYNVEAATKLVLQGQGTANEAGYVPPLLKENFYFTRAIPVTCVVVACGSSAWKPGYFSEAFHAYTSIPYGLLEAVGIPWIGDGYQNCAGLLSSLLGWNSCVEHNLNRLLTVHSQYLQPLDPDSAEIRSLLNPNTNTVQCDGGLCLLVRPLIGVVKPLLTGLGRGLTYLLDDINGLSLGRTDVTVLDIQCDPARLVY